MDSCIVYLTNNLTATVTGKNLYWYEEENSKGLSRYLFFGEQEDPSDDDIKVAEFCSACVMGIVRVSAKSEV